MLNINKTLSVCQQISFFIGHHIFSSLAHIFGASIFPFFGISAVSLIILLPDELSFLGLESISFRFHSALLLQNFFLHGSVFPEDAVLRLKLGILVGLESVLEHGQCTQQTHHQRGLEQIVSQLHFVLSLFLFQGNAFI